MTSASVEASGNWQRIADNYGNGSQKGSQISNYGMN